ncbi:putative non-ribosomal peptide synthase-like protein [Aspergillus alliaceus]|uniref:Putative non-ribosomal peptide synthase-like protein n=1 Tax=Petromyces alliaceus TaxID=209559 RepID=A0A5N7CDP7_PETAA|nr:putative non-ribosomal peptide synthase-like protein [Aspergillus alliaceus]
MAIQTIIDLLEKAAGTRDQGIGVYPRGSTEPQWLTYRSLRELARANSSRLRTIPSFKDGVVILLHFADHLDNIIWFWSTLYAGCIPAMSTPLPKVATHRSKHLSHLHSLLGDPICLTRKELWEDDGTPLRIVDIQTLPASASTMESRTSARNTPAVLMLTSGSTGQAKAVPLTQQQILASLDGKCAALPVEPDRVSFLNWIRLDHVGSLVEIHLHGLFLGTNQLHVEPENILANPLLFLTLIHKHRVGRTFAPNFFLVELLRLLKAGPENVDFDLSCLRYVVSGGESNSVEVCDRLSSLLMNYGAPGNVIVPGFGMTETCAGSIYNSNCPVYDLQHGFEFASVGECVPGIEMRARSGSIELRGPIVFTGYWNNGAATAEAFTGDGWFKTGDTGFIHEGKLHLSGRTKEMISINSVKYLPQDLDSAVEEAQIPGIIPQHVVCFAHFSGNKEEVCVVYCPDYVWDDIEARYNVALAITRRVLLITSTRPYILPLPRESLERTTLGKLSRSSLSTAMRAGQYAKQEEDNICFINEYKDRTHAPASTAAERIIAKELGKLFNLPDGSIGVNTNHFDLGLTSVQLLQLKRRIEQRLNLKSIPILTMMTNLTIRSLAHALTSTKEKEYNPVVTLQPHGKRTPLWLVHPGTGEALGFLDLARFFTDRPVYALHARGFDDTPPFTTVTACIDCYLAGIKAQQPHGPYAIAGYTLGALLAFELAKRLEADGQEVAFVASLDRLPYSVGGMRNVGFNQCLTHLAFFLGIISKPTMQALSFEHCDQKLAAVQKVVDIADSERMTELGLDAGQILKWADLMLALQMMLRQYSISGTVKSMDVFYCIPLEIFGCGLDEWKEKMKAWGEYTRQGARYHRMDGEHHNILGPKYVRGLHKAFSRAMEARGI